MKTAEDFYDDHGGYCFDIDTDQIFRFADNYAAHVTEAKDAEIEWLKKELKTEYDAFESLKEQTLRNPWTKTADALPEIGEIVLIETTLGSYFTGVLHAEYFVIQPSESTIKYSAIKRWMPIPE